MLEYIKKCEVLNNAKYKNELDLYCIVGTTQEIVNSKKSIRKREIKQGLESAVNSVGLF